MKDRKVYICLMHCAFFHNEGKGQFSCGHNSTDEAAQYEREGDYPLCPQYEDKDE